MNNSRDRKMRGRCPFLSTLTNGRGTRRGTFDRLPTGRLQTWRGGGVGRRSQSLGVRRLDDFIFLVLKG